MGRKVPVLTDSQKQTNGVMMKKIKEGSSQSPKETGVSRTQTPKVTKRSRTKAKKPNLMTSLLGDSPLEITVKIPEEDKKAIVETVNKMADKMDFRWKRTQQLIIIGYVMTASSFIISKLI